MDGVADGVEFGVGPAALAAPMDDVGGLESRKVLASRAMVAKVESNTFLLPVLKA